MLWYNQPGFESAPTPEHILSLSLFLSLMVSLCLSVFLSLFHIHINLAKLNPALHSTAWHILEGKNPPKKLHPLQHPLDILLTPVAKLTRRGQRKDKTLLRHVLPFLLEHVHLCKISLKRQQAGDKNRTPFSDSCTHTNLDSVLKIAKTNLLDMKPFSTSLSFKLSRRSMYFFSFSWKRQNT